MNDFTKNNVVYAFIFPEDGCGGFDIAEVKLQRFVGYKKSGAPFLDYAFETKEDALKAMRERLQEIEDNA